MVDSINHISEIPADGEKKKMKFLLLWLQLKVKELYRTQADFARVINIREDQLSRILNGRICPNEKQREEIITALKIDYDPFSIKADSQTDKLDSQT